MLIVIRNIKAHQLKYFQLEMDLFTFGHHTLACLYVMFTITGALS